jgi:hypothetical protein
MTDEEILPLLRSCMETLLCVRMISAQMAAAAARSERLALRICTRRWGEDGYFFRTEFFELLTGGRDARVS